MWSPNIRVYSYRCFRGGQTGGVGREGSELVSIETSCRRSKPFTSSSTSGASLSSLVGRVSWVALWRATGGGGGQTTSPSSPFYLVLWRCTSFVTLYNLRPLSTRAAVSVIFDGTEMLLTQNLLHSTASVTTVNLQRPKTVLASDISLIYPTYLIDEFPDTSQGVD